MYAFMPPLYKTIPAKGKEEYLYDDKALEQYRKKHAGQSFTLQRYKGLGEMDPQQLWETTLDPKTRRLRRIEIGDARLSSDVTEILMGTDVPPRKDFIYEHDFEYAKGREIEARTYRAVGGRKEFSGKLKDFSSENITIEEEDGEITIPRAETSLIRLAYDF